MIPRIKPIQRWLKRKIVTNFAWNDADIQVDLSTIDDPFYSFIEDTIMHATQHGVNVLLSEERSLESSDSEDPTPCNGYFCGDTPELAVACGQPFVKWFHVFIHESSHMDQWAEDSLAWTDDLIRGVSSYDLLDLWLNHDIELTEEQKSIILPKALYVELDCERRVIEKIKEYNIPIDVVDYAQRANAYVYFYLLMGHTRQWYEIGKEPYNFDEMVKQMPTTLDGDYTTLPEDIKTLMLQHMYPDLLQG